MVLQRPSARIEVGGGDGLGAAAAGVLGGGDLGFPEAAVLRLVIEQSVDTAHDRVELDLSILSPLADTAPGSEAKVALGYGDELTDVATAHVLRVDRTPHAIHLTAYAPSRRLSVVFIARSYVQQSVADVVTDLLESAEVDAGAIEASHDLAAYHVDGSRSAWEEIHRLAGRTGSQVTSTADGSVSFGPAPGSSSGSGLGFAVAAVASAVGVGSGAELRKGANLLAWRTGVRGATPDWTPAVAAVGAASPFGPDRWHHLVKQPSAATDPFRVDPAVRSASSADTETTAFADAARRGTRTGRFETLGDPTLRAGGTVTVEDESYRILRVRHHVDPQRGFRSLLTVEGAE
jgi:phage protein D